jgi:hypothetical protein
MIHAANCLSHAPKLDFQYKTEDILKKHKFQVNQQYKAFRKPVDLLYEEETSSVYESLVAVTGRSFM